MTASLLVQTLLLLLLLILLFNTYPYLFKKVLNLESHSIMTWRFPFLYFLEYNSKRVQVYGLLQGFLRDVVILFSCYLFIQPFSYILSAATFYLKIVSFPFHLVVNLPSCKRFRTSEI